MDRYDILHSAAPFADLGDKALAELAHHTHMLRFDEGDAIIRAGELGEAMYIVGEGTVRVQVTEGDRNRTLAWLGAGEVFGEMALMMAEPRGADVFADERCTCLVIHKEPLYDHLEAHPKVAHVLTELIGDRLVEGGQISKVGKYQITHELGRGGMAIVYGGYHPELRRPVAMKMLNHSLAFDRDFAQRFWAEAAIIAQLEHPNIVRVFDYERAYSTQFIVMEMVPGTSLEEMQRKVRHMEETQARRIIIQLASALDYAHRRGIVHRDMKPENVMMPPGGQARLMDFGIAKGVGEEPETDDLVGTAEFMSPEQGRGKDIDGRTDIYALGIMAFEMLTGYVPFESEDPFEIIERKETEDVPLVRSVRPGVSEAWDQFIQKACARDPDDRYATCAEILEHFGATPSLLREGIKGRTINLLYDQSEETVVAEAVDRLCAEVSGRQVVVSVAEHEHLSG